MPRPPLPFRLKAQDAKELAALLHGGVQQVRVVLRAMPHGGLESALYERPRPGAVRLIAQEAVKRRVVPRVGRETIRMLLQSHDLKPWRENNVVRG